MRNQSFWKYFDEYAAPKMELREVSFRKIFEYLDGFESPITIIETGCARTPDNWAGDGQSTLLFDKYVLARGQGSKVYSVDIDAAAVEYCRGMVSDSVNVTAEDSVSYLNRLTRLLKAENTSLHLLYLDSFDVDWNYWFPSAAHHLKELLAASRCVDASTLVVVDDCMQLAHLIVDAQGDYNFGSSLNVGGKGRLVAEYAAQVGATMSFAHYQVGWVNF